jgi:hypothetical protein
MSELRLRVYRVDQKCLDSEGEWDGTWDDSYDWEIYDEEGFTIAGMGGYLTREKAREAGEKKLNELKERK